MSSFVADLLPLLVLFAAGALAGRSRLIGDAIASIFASCVLRGRV